MTVHYLRIANAARKALAILYFEGYKIVYTIGVTKIKPRFKRFEMHGNLPAALQHGTVVSASKQTKGVDGQTHANRIHKSAGGERKDSKYPEDV